MAFIALRQLLDHAAEHGYGVPAFNVNNMEQIQAIMQAAEATASPVILQASAGARKYAGEPYLRHLVLAALEAHPDIPLVLHQDHGASPAVCQQAIRSGFTSVMMDGSLLPDQKTAAAYEYNVDVSRRVVEAAHAVGVSVEGELGCLGSLETGTAGEEDGVGAQGQLSRDDLLTDPSEAQIFVEATGVDALAIAIGTSHGAYKFSRQPTGDILAIDRIVEIHERIPNTHLVMHGSSSVPQEWLAVIREYGGEWRAQGQYRHRHPARDERRDAQVDGECALRVRSARRAKGGNGGGKRALCQTVRGIRLRGPGVAHQTATARCDGAPLPLSH
jgi:fructose-bisphosphate aldolase class II